MEHKKEQELKDIKNVPALLFADIRGFQETADLKFPDSIAKLAFPCCIMSNLHLEVAFNMS